MSFGLGIVLLLQVTNEAGGGVHAQRWDLRGTGVREGLGTSISSGHDLDGDRVPDVAIAAQANYVLLASGSDGSEIHRLLPPAGYSLPRCCSLIGDTDADGVSEVAVMWRYGNRLCLYSGRSGALLWSMDFGPRDYGSALCEIGDVDSNGSPDYCWTEVGWDSGRGRIQCGTWYDGIRADRNALSALSGGRIRIDLSFPPAYAGSSFALLASNGRGPTQWGEIYVPLTDDALLRRVLTQPPQWLTGGRGQLDAFGRASAVIDLPAGITSHRLGSTIYLAGVIGVRAAPVASSVATGVFVLP